MISLLLYESFPMVRKQGHGWIRTQALSMSGLSAGKRLCSISLVCPDSAWYILHVKNSTTLCLPWVENSWGPRTYFQHPWGVCLLLVACSSCWIIIAHQLKTDKVFIKCKHHWQLSGSISQLPPTAIKSASFPHRELLDVPAQGQMGSCEALAEWVHL